MNWPKTGCTLELVKIGNFVIAYLSFSKKKTRKIELQLINHSFAYTTHRVMKNNFKWNFA